MKALLLTLLILTGLQAKWSFKLSDVATYNDYQIEVLQHSYLVGEKHGLGLTLVAIAIVESRAGKFDFNINHICGAHQLNTKFTEATCETLENSPFVSALEAKKNFRWWLDYTNNNWAKSIKHYNAGFKLVPHSVEYHRRIALVLNQIRTSEQTFLTMLRL